MLTLTSGNTIRLPERFEVRGLLGSGGLADVFRVFDRHLGNEVALKVPHCGETPENEMARLEFEVLRKLNHRNIIKTLDFVESQDRFLSVMEWIDGPTLEELVEQVGRLDHEDFIFLSSQLMAGLDFLHRSGWLHCDLKPSNLMIHVGESSGPRLKIIDFGQAQPIRLAARPGRIAEREILATPEFVAPEVLEGWDFTPAADLYAAGHVLFTSLAARTAYAHDDPQAVLQAHLRGDPIDFGVFEEPLNPDLLSWMRRLMARNPRDRWPSARDALKALKFICRSQKSAD